VRKYVRKRVRRFFNAEHPDRRGRRRQQSGKPEHPLDTRAFCIDVKGKGFEKRISKFVEIKTANRSGGRGICKCMKEKTGESGWLMWVVRGGSECEYT